MKKFAAILLLLTVLAGGALAQHFWPIYWATGKVWDANDGSGVVAEGHRVCFYRSDAERLSGIYTIGYIGIAGGLTTNIYMLNLFQNVNLLNLLPGTKGYAAVIQDDRKYGAGPVEFTLSGRGYDLLADMRMGYGLGITEPPLVGAYYPLISGIQFNNRLYHKVLVEKGEKFIISPTPIIKFVVEESLGFGIDPNSISIQRVKLGEGEQGSQTFEIKGEHLTRTTRAAAAAGAVTALNVEYSVSREDKFDEGDYQLTFYASDVSRSMATAEVCWVTVMGGPAQIIGDVIVFPSPYSPPKDGNAIFEYTLSVDADLEIYLYSIAGDIIKRLYTRSGQEGGSAGVNKVTWDGKTTFGKFAANGIYQGTIYDPKQGKTLAKFKLTVFH